MLVKIYRLKLRLVTEANREGGGKIEKAAGIGSEGDYFLATVMSVAG